jgi:protein-S-isoprenylcysteine O-methyltransferase Ste14
VIGTAVSKLFRRLFVSLFVPIILIVALPIASVILGKTDRIAWRQAAPLIFVVPILGSVLIGAGIILLAATIPLFLRLDEGTIMPWEPVRQLIVEGPYGHVRNPMHMGEFFVMIGEGLVLGSKSILVFTVFAVVLHLFYIPLSEERGLERRFGESYRSYKENVPRWIPRRMSWAPEDGEAPSADSQ